jgi:large subunit ribosomal protein L6
MLSRLERTELNTKGINIAIDVKNSVVSFEKNNQKLSLKHSNLLKAVHENQILTFVPEVQTPEAAAHLGTAISISRSHLKGLVQPFKQELELKGTGYKAALKVIDGKNVLVLTLGKSHDDQYVVPANVKVTVPAPTQIVLESIDKHALGQASAIIRRFRKRDAYKGKGILIKGQVVVLKETKKKK